jgi:four helix bundle protein
MKNSASFKDLEVWQEAVNLTDMVYRQTRKFPQEELFALTNQIRRAVVSIPSNIAEGSGRRSNTEFLQFLSIANGSLRELETQLIIAERIGYLSHEQLDALQPRIDSGGRLLTGSHTTSRKPPHVPTASNH